MSASSDDATFETEFEQALKKPSDEAAQAMLARGRFISYRETDTPPGYVIREYPNGKKILVRIDLAAATFGK